MKKMSAPSPPPPLARRLLSSSVAAAASSLLLLSPPPSAAFCLALMVPVRVPHSRHRQQRMRSGRPFDGGRSAATVGVGLSSPSPSWSRSSSRSSLALEPNNDQDHDHLRPYVQPYNYGSNKKDDKLGTGGFDPRFGDANVEFVPKPKPSFFPGDAETEEEVEGEAEEEERVAGTTEADSSSPDLDVSSSFSSSSSSDSFGGANKEFVPKPKPSFFPRDEARAEPGVQRRRPSPSGPSDPSSLYGSMSLFGGANKSVMSSRERRQQEPSMLRDNGTDPNFDSAGERGGARPPKKREEAPSSASASDSESRSSSSSFSELKAEIKSKRSSSPFSSSSSEDSAASFGGANRNVSSKPRKFPVEEEAKEKEDDGEEGFPTDPASTTPQLLSALWFMIAQGSDMTRGDTMTVEFPNMASQFTPSYLHRLTGHLDSCKDVCDDFGINTILMPYIKPDDPAKKVVGFTVKSYRNPDKKDGDEYENFDSDPFWDDVTDDDFGYIKELQRAYDDEDEEGTGFEGDLGVDESDLPEIKTLIPDDDDEIVDVTKRWVDRMMSDLALCPFTSGPDMAGLPMGKVFYTVDRSRSYEDMYARYWTEVVRVEQEPERDLSTTLLIAPDFCMDNVESYENFCNTLTQPLEVLAVEDLLQLVFFHPKWTFRDGGERSGADGGAANYARRSPWPMINILRTSQVRTAQRGIPTGLVYKQNEKTLGAIGTRRLETMLRLRDWDDVKDEEKVDRTEMEALKMARDMQTTGVVQQRDDDTMSVAADATPAANKVDRSQVEGADMLNVVLEALERRLGGGPGGGVLRLSGPETSAAMMASDLLLERLGELEEEAAAAVVSSPRAKRPRGGSGSSNPYFDVEDDDLATRKETEERELDVLFGGSGIMEKESDVDDYGF